MFEARLTDGSILKDIVHATKDLVNHVNLDVSSTGLSMQAMDMSYVSVCTMLLKSERFEYYRCDRPMSLGVSLHALATILKGVHRDTLTMKAESDTLHLVLERDESVSVFELQLMDVDIEHMEIPEMVYTCTVELPARDFAKICGDLSVFGETCTIVVNNGIQFSVQGDIGTARVTCRTQCMQGSVCLEFSMRYLLLFCKAAPLSSTVTLSLSPEKPLMVYWGIEDGYVKNYLSPIVDVEPV